MKPNQQADLLVRNLAEVISEEELVGKLTVSSQNKKPLVIKAGFDPSAPDIHLGHTVLLRKLRIFQECGHIVHFIIGDATARVGDPSGLSQTRPNITNEQIQQNAKTYQDQAFRILDPKKTKVLFNAQWLASMRFDDFMKLVSCVTVRQIIDRDDFQKRLHGGQPISMMELLYPLMQAYDSVHIRADVELGGTDQKFNLLLGRELQRVYGQAPQVVMTLPLLVGLDGIQKMSKSLSNHIGILDPPKEMFGKIMSIPDNLMKSYYALLTQADGAAITKAIDSGEMHPKTAKQNLALNIVEQYHGVEEAKKASTEFDKVFVMKGEPDDINYYSFDESELVVTKIIIKCHLATSINEARRLVQQGAVYINGKRITDFAQTVDIDSDNKLIKVGKRRFARFSRKT